MSGLITFGETMALLSTPTIGPMRHASSLLLGVGGAESNVAVGAHRLGMPARWVGRVGDDELGRMVTSRIRGEGVHVRAITDPGAPTGLMLKEQRTSQLTRVSYYRNGSAGSRLCPQDLDPAEITSADVLHVTGITPALSSSAAATVHEAVAIARAAGVTVSLDYNYRRALWSPAQAAPVLRELSAKADLVFASEDEAAMLTGAPDPELMSRQLQALGPACAVVRLGARGSVACLAGRTRRQAAIPAQAVDSVGAGDAYVAGFLTRWVAGRELPGCLHTAAAIGAFAVSVPGDWEGMPDITELCLAEKGAGAVTR